MSFDGKNLIGHWVHSHEEDEPGVQVFRTREFDFPPSRGRFGFELFNNSEATVFEIGAADKPNRNQWTWDLNKTSLRIHSEKISYDYCWIIKELAPSKLVLSKWAANSG